MMVNTMNLEIQAPNKSRTEYCCRTQNIVVGHAFCHKVSATS